MIKILIICFLFTGCYTPNKKEIELKRKIMTEKLKYQDSIIKNNLKWN